MKSRSALERPRKRAFLQHGGIRRTLLFILGAMVLGVGTYALAGFFGGPWLVDRWLGQYRDAAPGRTALRETVRFNPFTLVAEVVALQTRDEQAAAAFSVDRLVVDLAARSLLERRPVVSSIVLERPRIALGSVADLLALGRRARSTALYQARIDRFESTGGTFAAGLGTDRSIEFASLDLSLTGFDGRSGAAGQFSLDGVTAAQARLISGGSLAANLERADGQLRLDSLELGAVAARLGGIVGGAEPRGRIDLTADFDVTSLLTAPTLELSDASLELSALSLTPAAGLTVSADGAAASASLVLATSADGVDVSGRVEIDGARLSVQDSRVRPAQSFVLENAIVLATADADGDGLSLSVGGGLRGAGDATLTLRAPPEAAARRRVSIEATGLPATMLSSYAVDALGRPLAGGETDLDLDYSLNGSRVDGSLRIVARELAFAPQTADSATSVGGPSLELATALLEDTDGIIEIDLPFAGNTGTVRDAAGAALTARLATVTATPFDILEPLPDGARATANAVPFLPGDAALNDSALAMIARLADALNARPRLGMRVHGGYDATVDRDALARQQIELHVQLATAGPSTQARPAPVDFGSERAQDVLDEFAAERLPAERVAALANRFECEGAFVAVCKRTYYELIFDELVENEGITPTALNRLGRFRALSVVDALRQHGIADERIELVTGSDVVDSPFGVGLRVELTAAATALQ